MTTGAGFRPLHGGTASDGNARQFEMGPWSEYIPTWTSSGSAPSIGNGTLLGRYRRHGTTLHLQCELIVGSTTTVGSGEIRLSIPSGMTAASALFQQIGVCFWWDQSTSSVTRGVAIINASGTVLFPWLVDGTPGGDSAGFGTSDRMHFAITFEIAA